MINERIDKLREELNKLINERADFDEIQEISRELDKCVLKYYQEILQRGW